MYKGKRILIIDDDRDILEILNIILEHEQFEPITSYVGMPLDEITATRPDLILLDVRISGYDKTGLQICTEVKDIAHDFPVPVILVSAEAKLDQLAQDCGADGFIAKPFDIDTVIEKVKKFLS